MTRMLLLGDESFNNEVNLYILNKTINFVCLQIDLINHFIFSEFLGVFPIIHDYMATILQFLHFNLYV